jgi:hypothetical protein
MVDESKIYLNFDFDDNEKSEQPENYPFYISDIKTLGHTDAINSSSNWKASHTLKVLRPQHVKGYANIGDAVCGVKNGNNLGDCNFKPVLLVRDDEKYSVKPIMTDKYFVVGAGNDLYSAYNLKCP